MKKYIIITTINEKTEAIKRFEEKKDWYLVIVGDKKSKIIENSGNLIFLSIKDQKKLNYEFNEKCPYNHYVRKNIGYIYAMKNGADIIYDTDDDNFPNKYWKEPVFNCNKIITTNDTFINIYKYFSKDKIWPRGYPLGKINTNDKYKILKTEDVKIGVWQGLADNDPDVDAIYRLTINKPVFFKKRKSLYLNKFNYCPFNSQNTFWDKEMFPLLYLPSTVSFRFTDILRGYITQRILWEHNRFLGFSKASVEQKRNIHNYLKDFEDEIDCFLKIDLLVDVLNKIKLSESLINNIKLVYEALVLNNIVDNIELTLLNSWINDIKINNF